MLVNVHDVAVLPDARIYEALQIIDRSGYQAAVVVDADGVLQGIATDGDVRRGLLRGLGLDAPISEVMNKSPIVARPDQSRDLILRQVKQFGMRHLPVVDSQGRLVRLEVVRDEIALDEGISCAVLMAGGLGSRLLPLTETTPKPLLHIGDKSILERIVVSLADQGVRRIYISLNYKADLIEAHCGTGEKWGVEIRYLRENSRLGTAGALGLLPEKLERPFLVMNGDIITSVNLRQFFEFHHDSRASATIGAFAYEHQIPFGVLEMEGGYVSRIEEKPTVRKHVSAGVYVLSTDVLRFIRPNEYLDMPDLIRMVTSAKMRVAAFPIREYWIDIGRHEDLRQAAVDAASDYSEQSDRNVEFASKPLAGNTVTK